MIENCSILAAIHPLTEQGRKFLGDGWQSFLDTLRSSLNQQGLEDHDSSNALLLFRFEKPFTAVASLLENLHKAREAFSWDRAAGPLPLQIVFHLEIQGDLTSPLRDPSSTLWNILKTEHPYITHSLKLEWEQRLAGENLPRHFLGEEEDGLYPLRFADQTLVKTERFFPYRSLPVSGPLSPCFYCGMTSHKPSGCPSKQLSLAIHALDKIGYLPLADLVNSFQDAFGNQERMTLLLADGVTFTDLRRDFSLQVFVAYFDLMRIFQIRFLLHIAFSSRTQWEELVKAETTPKSNNALHLALDCLRVGQYSQAEAFFFEESRRPGGRQFYATVGRAFIALEQDRANDMGHFLESASTMATTETEKIYISLLLSRYFELQGNTWKAEHALDNIFAMDMDCAEAIYRQIQLAVKLAFSDRELYQLRFLVSEQKEYFMRAFLDPLLVPCYGPVEDMLSLRLDAKREEAEGQLTQLQALCEELQEWLEPEDEYLQVIIRGAGDLANQFQRRSYYDFLAVADTATKLINESYRLQEDRLDRMKEKKEKAAAAHEGYVKFWNLYPYQGFFKGFQEALVLNKEKLETIQKESEQMVTGKGYRKITATLEEIEELLTKLHPMVVRMGWTKIFLDGMKFFMKRLIITEVILLLGCFISLPVLAFWLDNTAGAGIVEMLQTPWVQRQILFVVTILVAPMLALAQTLWKASDT